MSLRVIAAIALVAIVAFAFAVWNISIQTARAPSAASGGSEPAPGASTPGEAAAPGEGTAPGMTETPAPLDPGVTWRVPERWTIDLAQGMRLATYIVPAAGGAERAECAVYYFGPGQGGGVDANLQRWMGEFRPLEKHDVRKLGPGGIEVTRIVARGTYVAHSMRGPENPGEKPRWALMGAVVKGPKGDLFFKLTGPAATVDAAAPEFDRMLDSIRRK